MTAKALYQRGANGLIAEHQCAAVLNARLARSAHSCITPQGALDGARDAAVAQFSKDLTSQQITRALMQGGALGEFLATALNDRPETVGVSLDYPLRATDVEVEAVGRLTGSGSSADIVVYFWHNGTRYFELPVSLKAYRGSISSLGSKGAKASLARLFLDSEKVTDSDFVRYFGPPAKEFLALVQLFRSVSKEFYASSSEGRAFVDAYQVRKGTRKVNNPLRRKELGDYFLAKQGFKSEHAFAEQYVLMFNQGMRRLTTASEWKSFLESMRFVLGMDKDVLTLNAIAGDLAQGAHIENSFDSGAYAQVRKVLVPGCAFDLIHRPGSSMIGVEVSKGDVRVRCLQLAMWKDATIQFKLDSGLRK